MAENKTTNVLNIIAKILAAISLGIVLGVAIWYWRLTLGCIAGFIVAYILCMNYIEFNKGDKRGPD